MNAGIDFGTSTCSIGVWRDGRPLLLKLEGDSTRLISALHSARTNLGVGQIDARELEKRVAALARPRRKTPKTRKTPHAVADPHAENRARGEWRMEIERARIARLVGQG